MKLLFWTHFLITSNVTFLILKLISQHNTNKNENAKTIRIHTHYFSYNISTLLINQSNEEDADHNKQPTSSLLETKPMFWKKKESFPRLRFIHKHNKE